MALKKRQSNAALQDASVFRDGIRWGSLLAKGRCNLGAVMGRVVQVFVLVGAVLGARGSELPAASEVLKRVQARMELNYADAPTNRYQYTRTNVIGARWQWEVEEAEC